jgi:hypothetical protein
MICELKVNTDQSIIDKETLGMIYQSKKIQFSLGTSSLTKEDGIKVKE